MNTWRVDVQAALENIGGQGSLEAIYAAVRLLRPAPMPATWQSIVRRELEYNSSDSESFQQRYDLFYSVGGIGKGIWGLRSSEIKTPAALDLAEPQPGRIETTVYRILRDTQLARRLKRLHSDACQICGHTIQVDDTTWYSEAHHLKPLGRPHNGPDVAENIVVLCPNHHALLDLGLIAITPATFSTVAGHNIGTAFVEYHNSIIHNLPMVP